MTKKTTSKMGDVASEANWEERAIAAESHAAELTMLVGELAHLLRQGVTIHRFEARSGWQQRATSYLVRHLLQGTITRDDVNDAGRFYDLCNAIDDDENH